MTPMGRPSGAPVRGSGPTIAAVLVTHEPSLDRLQLVLDSLSTQDGIALSEILVVDNGSSNLAALAQLIADVDGSRLLPLAANQGVGAALNAGWRALTIQPDWVLTLDQDSVLERGALAAVLDAFDALGPEAQAACGVLATSHVRRRPRPVIERERVLAELGALREVKRVITSGNLVRAAVLLSVSWDDRLFIDGVDWSFCAEVQRAGWRIFETRQPMLDHRIGAAVRSPRGPAIYEGGTRPYYIFRNSCYLLTRRQIPTRMVVRDLTGHTTSYLAVNGFTSLPRLAWLAGHGLADGLRGKLGPYPGGPADTPGATAASPPTSHSGSASRSSA